MLQKINNYRKEIVQFLELKKNSNFIVKEIIFFNPRDWSCSFIIHKLSQWSDFKRWKSICLKNVSMNFQFKLMNCILFLIRRFFEDSAFAIQLGISKWHRLMKNHNNFIAINILKANEDGDRSTFNLEIISPIELLSHHWSHASYFEVCQHNLFC